MYVGRGRERGRGSRETEVIMHAYSWLMGVVVESVRKHGWGFEGIAVPQSKDVVNTTQCRRSHVIRLSHANISTCSLSQLSPPHFNLIGKYVIIPTCLD